MTLTTLITINATLGAALAYLLVVLLSHGVHSDRDARQTHVVRLEALPAEERERIAA